MLHLLIDGYNLLYAETRKQSLTLKEERDLLLQDLNFYTQIKRVKITVVFDGSRDAALYPHRERLGQIEIVFTLGDQSADDWIDRKCEENPGAYLVVSSDQAVVNSAERSGCLAISSTEFLRKLDLALKSNDPFSDIEEKDDSGPLYPKISTKKKGAARRPPKRERQKKRQLNQL